jgi:hypothetical protein
VIVVPVVPTAYLVARWVRFYGSGEYYAPDRYRSSDGTVPWQRFVLLGREIDRLVAADQLTTKRAVEHGYASARVDDVGLRRMTEELEEYAYPRVMVERRVLIDPAEEM